MARPKPKSHRLTSAFTAVALVAAGAHASGIAEWRVSADLNGDGFVELFTLVESGEDSVHLRIENTGGGEVLAERIAQLGGIGQRPELSLAPNGSVRLTSMNEAIGRHRWRLTLTIAHRRGVYIVAGYTYRWYDTLDPDDTGVCD